MTRRTLTILGSTGSIGTQTLDVIQRSADDWTIKWLTCNTRVEELADQVRQFRPHGVAIREEWARSRFLELLPEFTGPVLCGEEGLCEAAADTDNDIVMSAMVGFSGVVPTLAAIRSGHVVGLANKETLVSAGGVIMAAARDHGATLLAVDSEHSAILQCLCGEQLADVERFVITASGGPFRALPQDELQHVTVDRALRHPNWSMGRKITIDSATLMNKGFEVMEARWLFDIDVDRIDVVIHPQSIIHSMVEFVDGSVKAQMGLPSMLVPIQYALTYPRHAPLDTPRMNLAEIGTLTFESPDLERFPCLRIAYEALRAEGNSPCIVNAANEIAVSRFLDGHIPFTSIPAIIEKTLSRMNHVDETSLSDILATDAEARRIAADIDA
ncbi:MAG TPA: 1-deoxy-D-xylulose-5-phosphate reductoisomerase [Bacteroidetes bacterium]|nr:1-deoxy-D-xylulose-5-phosphate reductoisomerase [Bacteroidota bacterium]HRK03550.1 1-deoxy-D-xylulose-5-phosphate reductoisomerase [Chlorobiota bacterium]